MRRKLDMKMKYSYAKINYNTSLEFSNFQILLIKYAN
jgi:hypothetical protein